MVLITVSSDETFGREVREAIDLHIRFEAVWSLEYGDTSRLRAATTGKHIVVIDFRDPDRALEVARAVDGRPEFASIALGGGNTRNDLLHLMQAGIREVLPDFTAATLLDAVNRAATKLAAADESLGDVYAFVPAKPGCGATTLATNAMAIAAQSTSEPTLLLDFDIRLGVTSFLLKAEGNHTIVDALQQSDRLDADLWSNLVSQKSNLHVLGSGPVDFARHIPVERFTELLDFAIRKYSLVGVDLPGTMEDHECAALLRSKRVFLVCTPDIGALHVARRKSNWLRDLGLADKVSVILNCVERRNNLSVADIERIIQMPVRYLMPADADEVARAVRKGGVIEGSSQLAKQIAKLAQEMIATRVTIKKPSPVRRFVEYFSISAAREGRIE